MNRTLRLLVLLLTLCMTVGYAQQDQGVVTGTISDNSGAVIPGAQITVTDVERNTTQTVESNMSGVYVVGPIKIGTYEITVESEGFKKAVRSGVEVHPGDRIGLDFAMEIGNIVEVVEVTGATPMLQTQEASLSHVVQRRDIEQLPINTRNYQTLALMSAGVVPEIGGRDLGPTMEGGHTRSGFVSHGQPSGQNNYVLDGIDNNNTIMGQQDRKSQAVIPSLDAVQEFKVQTSNYSAEFGRNAGAVVNISIKGGTNNFHGSAYDFLRNDKLDARPTFSYADRTGDGKADPEVLRQNQFGATMGGPVIKNKTFFFGSYEGWRIRRAATARANVPSSLERNADFSATPNLAALIDPTTKDPFPGDKIPPNRWDPVAVSIMKLYPEPNFQDVVTRTNYLSGPPNTIDRNQIDGRVDHRFSENDTIFGRYSYYTFDNHVGGPWPGIADSGDLHDNFGRHLTISETHIFSPNLVNEFRFGYKYLKPNRRSPSNTPLADANAQVGIKGVTIPEVPVMGMSRIQYTGNLGFAQLGGNFFNPNLKDMGTFQFVDNLTWVKGNHSIKFGADLRFEDSNIFGGLHTRGGFTFDGRYTGVSLGDSFLGWAYQINESRLDLAEFRFPGYMFYVQDDWKITQNLTINLGIRYELRPPWREKNGRFNFVNFDPNSSEFGAVTTADANGGSTFDRTLQYLDKDNIAPRIGLAWRFKNKWTFRAGGGAFYGGQMGLGASARPSGNFPFAAQIAAQGNNSVPAGMIGDGIPAGFLGEPAQVGHVDEFPNNSSVDVYDWNDPLPETWQWNFTVQRQLAADMSVEVAYVGSSTSHIDGTHNVNDGGPGPPNTRNARKLFTNLNALNLRTPWGHASYNGLDVNLRKRFSQGFTFTMGYTWGHSIGQLGEQFVSNDGTGTQDPTCFSCDRGNASNDVRHRFVTTYIFELPLGKGRKYLNKGGVSDAILGGWQITGMMMSQTGQFYHVTYNQKNAFLGTSQGEWRANVVGDHVLSNPTPDLWFNPAAFAQPCNPAKSKDWNDCGQGNLGRNSMQEDGIFNWDIGIGKTWNITERFRLQFRSEAFNVSNSPSFGTPSRGMAGANPGVIRSTNSTERQIQMGLRLSW